MRTTTNAVSAGRGLTRALLAALVAGAALLAACQPGAPAGAKTAKAGSAMSKDLTGTEVATLGGGCFWCTEAVYERTEGVVDVVSGYSGGKKKDPTYEEVSSSTTGHAEVVQVYYDPKKISYEKILEIFWKAHDPTTPNRQGADVGTQYRSIILYHDEVQRQIAEKSKAAAAASSTSPIVTEIKPFELFYPAEDYHQDYYERNPFAGYCTFVIRPKLDKLHLPTSAVK
jgi:peptide-methionine (S)-S-oxide reductase